MLRYAAFIKIKKFILYLIGVCLLLMMALSTRHAFIVSNSMDSQTENRSLKEEDLKRAGEHAMLSAHTA